MQNLFGQQAPIWTRYKQWLVGAVLVLGVGLWWARQQPWFPTITVSAPGTGKSSADKKDQKGTEKAYRAVYLTNSQVFYGVPGGSKGEYLVLTDVFFFQPWLRARTPGNIRIVKLGTEIHQPQDMVYLSRSQVVMQEELSDESIVLQAIRKYNEQ